MSSSIAFPALVLLMLFSLTVSGSRFEDADLTTIELLEKYGYPAEVHRVTTDDGYILELHRIPNGRKGSGISAEARPAVLLQHGLLCSSAAWVVNGPGKGLAYLLADAGYDVWLGNNRGNTYSRNHTHLSPSKSAFWEFSWHELGYHDLPAMIDYVTEQTSQEKIHYIGHSQGTTQFWVMASERPEYNDKIRLMSALAPVAYTKNMASPIFKILARVTGVGAAEWIASLIGHGEFLPSTALISLAGAIFCKDEAITQFFCTNVMFLIAGYNDEQTNATVLPVILGHTPAGASTKQFVHFAQGYAHVGKAHFRQYDYGVINNYKRYGTLTPPEYNLENISAPVALYNSFNDLLGTPKDVQLLENRLPNVIGKFTVPDQRFNHLDFMWAKDADTIVFNRVIKTMQLF